MIKHTTHRLEWVFIGIFFCLHFFLSLYKLPESMRFIGDQGWFYLSARDILIKGEIPLVGITASRTWLHQGPLWTYMLAVGFSIFRFSPISGAYVAIAINSFSIPLVYFLTRTIFSRKVAIVSVILYVASPLIIILNKFPYHTSVIPFFTLIFLYSLRKWIEGNKTFFIVSICCLSVLYNLELATVTLGGIVLTLLIYGYRKKKKYFRILQNKNVLIVTGIAFIVPMIPIVLYDINNGFNQTVKFLAWVFYRTGQFSFQAESSMYSTFGTLQFMFSKIKLLVTFPHDVIFFVVFLGAMCYLLYSIKSARKGQDILGQVILLLSLIVPIIGILVNQTHSDAYLPILFPSTIILISRVLSLGGKGFLSYAVSIILVVSIVSLNVKYMAENIYFPIKYVRGSYQGVLSTSSRIISEAKGRRFAIKTEGEGSQFESSTMTYDYVLWWLGSPPSKRNEKLLFIIREDDKGTYITKKEK